MKGLDEVRKNLAALSFFSSPLYLKYKLLIVPGFVLIIAITIASLVTVPQFLKLFETFRTIEELKQQQLFFQKKIAELEAVNDQEYKQDLDTALVALPVDKDIPGVLSNLLVALSGSGMTLENISFASTSDPSSKVTEYKVQLDVSGQESDLRNFLERVKLSPRIIKLTSIEISKSLGGNQDLQASLSFIALYQELPTNIGAVDKPLPKISKDDTQVLADIKAKLEALPKAAPAASTPSVTGKLNPFAP